MKRINILLLLFILSCNDTYVDYSQIERIETVYIPFGINFPIDIEDSAVKIGGEKSIITDEVELKEISKLLKNLVPSKMKNIRVRDNVYLKSEIKLKSNNKKIILITNKQFILLNNKVYEYSDSLINTLKGK